MTHHSDLMKIDFKNSQVLEVMLTREPGQKYVVELTTGYRVPGLCAQHTTVSLTYSQARDLYLHLHKLVCIISQQENDKDG